jgi:hypothetical protein
MDRDGRALPQIIGAPINPVTSKEERFYTLIKANYIIPSTVTARKSVIVDAGYFDQTLRRCEDWDLWLRIAPYHRFVDTDRVLVRYRMHADSLSNDLPKIHSTKRALVEKHFGTDDGIYPKWPLLKRRAYSGMYRFETIAAVKHSGDFHAGAEYLEKALTVDPCIASDVELFYELALWDQPAGYRGSKEKVDIHKNTKNVLGLIQKMFRSSGSTQIHQMRRQVLGTAYYAIGLVAYNVGELQYVRRGMMLAARYSPSLFFSTGLLGILLKSMLGNSVLDSLRRLKKIVLPRTRSAL